METIVPVTESAQQKEPQNPSPLTSAVATTTAAAPVVPSVSVIGSPLAASKDATALSVPTMQAPKTQAPQRLRRIPVVDPSTLIPARRSSTRSIKRKKFDDELVESSLVKTERGRSVKAGGPVSATSSPTLGLISSAGTTVVHGGVHVTTPALSPAGDASITLDASPGLISSSFGSSGDASARGALANSAGLIPVCVLQPTVTAVSTVAATSGSAVAQVSSGASASVPGQSAATSVKSGKDISIKRETEKHSDKGSAVKPPAEKRSRPSSGKSTTVSKGSAGTKVASSRPVTSKSGGSKSSGSRSGVAKSKSRATIRIAFKNILRSRHPSTLLRRKLKEENPAKYEEFLLKQRMRDRQRREKAKQQWEEGYHTRAQIEELEAQKEAKRVRERDRYRRKKKKSIRQTLNSSASITPVPAEKKRPKDMTPDELRSHKSAQRRKQRECQSHQKKSALRAKERRRYQQRKMLKLQQKAAALPKATPAPRRRRGAINN